MLRIWMEDLGAGQLDWRGRIQHINSGEALFFRDWKTLICFIKNMVLGRGNPEDNNQQKGEGFG